MVAAHGGGDPGESPLYGPSGVGPTTHRPPAQAHRHRRRVGRTWSHGAPWNPPSEWVTSKEQTHEALVSEAEFRQAQRISAMPIAPLRWWVAWGDGRMIIG